MPPKSKAAAAVETIETEWVEIVTKVEHDLEELLPGTRTEMPKSSAKALYAVGAAKPTAAPVAEETKPQ